MVFYIMMTKKDPSIFVIVLNWNNSTDTVECLKSFQKVQYDNYKIIVVDNNSEDNSVAEIRNFIESHEAEILLIENNENSGFAGGNNVGIKHALESGADYVMVLNNDTTVDNSILRDLVNIAVENSNAGIITPAIYFSDNKDKLWFGGESGLNWIRMEHAIYSSLENKALPVGITDKRVNFLTGACMFIKEEVLRKIKGFDERFFLYFEDADFSLRTVNEGYDLLWTPKAKIWHKISSTTLPQAGSAIMNYYNVRNIMLLAKKHGPWWVRYFYMHIWAYYKFTKQLIKFAFPNKYNIDLARAIMQGIQDYYRGKFGKYVTHRN
ncbi:MAG: glycosyltransferase family 2 protein [Candidatus Spechtbacterales bacterium]|nr:glycosyltransferase family 2 protein [Candidatus Spechtbacterales bacterium]